MSLSRRDLLFARPAAPVAAEAKALAINTGACLTHSGVACGSCADVCPEGAIRLKPRLGGPPLATLNAALCNSCGDCVPICPVQAVQWAEATNA